MAPLKDTAAGALLLHTMLDQGLNHHRQGRLAEAEQLYRRILTVDPGHADSLHLLGMVAFQAGDCETAEAMIRQAIAANPNASSYHSNLGNVLQQMGSAREAASCYLKALRIKPDLAEAHVNLGNIFLACEEPEQAVDWYERAIALKPEIPETHKHLGDALRALNKLEPAVTAYERAITLRPQYADAFHELGGTLRGLGDLDGALKNFRRAQAIEPNHLSAGFAESLVQLLQQEFRAGWTNYERRWESRDHGTPMREYPQPDWRGEPLSGKVFLWPEQGVGDEIMFAGLLPDALRAGNRCVLECDLRLQPLFLRSFPGIEITSDREAPLDPQLEIAAQLPIGGLPFLFRNDRADFAAVASPYLKADPLKREHLRSRYTDGRLLVGVSWYSNNVKTGRNRSIDLAELAPLFEVQGIKWVSLQYGEHGSLEAQAAASHAPVQVDRDVDQMASLDDFAGQVAAMDLVITIDNTTAHLAGALGVPVWVLLPFAPDWRWFAEGDGSPWYPSMRLFRQSERQEWGPVVARVREALSIKSPI